jgi:predicted glutamine amidotransferase
LRDDPPRALARTLGHIERVRVSRGIEQPISFSACTTDGRRLWAVRYSSNGHSRTLYHSCHLHALHDIDGTYEPLPDGAVVVVSEPLDEMTAHWEAIPESSTLMVENGATTVTRFAPK